MAFVSPLAVSSSGTKYTSLALTGLRQHRNLYQKPRNFTLPAFGAPTKMTLTTAFAFKTALLEKVMPLEFGRKIVDYPKDKAEVDRLVRELESANRSREPIKDPNLSGVWQMLYTTSTSILRISFPAFLRPVRITQIIDVPNLFARNEEEFKIGPFRFTNAVEARLEPVSRSRVTVKFVQFIVAGLFKFNVEKNDRFKGELDVTYLDDDLRISRGDRGNLFVLQKTE